MLVKMGENLPPIFGEENSKKKIFELPPPSIYVCIYIYILFFVGIYNQEFQQHMFFNRQTLTSRVQFSRRDTNHYQPPATSYQETQSRGRKGSESPVRGPQGFLEDVFFSKKKTWGRFGRCKRVFVGQRKKIWYGYRVKVNVQCLCFF